MRQHEATKRPWNVGTEYDSPHPGGINAVSFCPGPTFRSPEMPSPRVWRLHVHLLVRSETVVTFRCVACQFAWSARIDWLPSLVRQRLEALPLRVVSGNSRQLRSNIERASGRVKAPFLSHPPSLRNLTRGFRGASVANPSNVIVHRYVDIPCPSGKHQRSLVTFRNHTVAAMFCVPCEHAWTEPTTRPELRDLSLDIDDAQRIDTPKPRKREAAKKRD
jgi:Zn ribbon nucleic-acid-binding protein